MQRSYYDYNLQSGVQDNLNSGEQPLTSNSTAPDLSPTRNRDFGIGLSVPRLPTEIENASTRRRHLEESRYPSPRPPQAQGTRLSLSSCMFLFHFFSQLQRRGTGS